MFQLSFKAQIRLEDTAVAAVKTMRQYVTVETRGKWKILLFHYQNLILFLSCFLSENGRPGNELECNYIDTIRAG